MEKLGNSHMFVYTEYRFLFHYFQIKDDIMSSEPNQEIRLVSNVVSVHMINPLEDGEFDVIDSDGDAGKVSIKMLDGMNVTNNYQV